MRFGLGLGFQKGGGFSTYTPPAGFLSAWDYRSQFSILRKGRTYRSTINTSTYLSPAGANARYVSNINGSNSDNGTTEALAYLTPYYALQNAPTGTPCIVYLDANGGTGWYNYTDMGWLTTQAALVTDIIFKPYNGNKIIFTTDQQVTWSKTAGRTNVYQKTANLLARCADNNNLDAYGMPTPLTWVSSIATCDSTPNSFFYDSGGILYVHTFDSRAVTGNHPRDSGIFAGQVQSTRRNCDFSGAFDFNSQNCHFWGGNYALAVQTTDASTKNSVHVGGSSGYAGSATAGSGTLTQADREAVRIRDRAFCAFIDFKGAYSGLDAMAYLQPTGSTQMKFLEERFVGYNCQNTEAANNDIVNGSSAHGGVDGVRLNTIAFNNSGGQITDTGSGTTTLNLGITTGNSTAATQGAGGYDTGFRFTSSCTGYIKDATINDTYNSVVISSSTVYNEGGIVDNSSNSVSGSFA